MAGKKFTGAPFGCQTARFDVSAVYPELKKPGTYTQVSYCKKATSELGASLAEIGVDRKSKVQRRLHFCGNGTMERRLGPGTYEAGPGDFSPSVLERNASAPGWKRAEETERLTEMPHLLYKETWERNRFLKQNMGPGRYNTKSFVEMMEEKPSSVRGACNTRDARFKEDSKNSNPGPGTYGKGGNPYALIEERASKSASSKGIMDSETSKCRSATSVGSDLGPGTYNMKGSTDETLKHVVGKRGPYDLFTGSRSGPIPYGYFATPNSPGPGSYETKPLFASVRNSSAPFLTSAKRFDRKSCRILFGSSNPVGVGRYNIEKPARGKTATCFRTSFLSKTGRYLSNFERDKVLQERIQKSHSASSAGKLLAPAYDSTT
ncbi:lymphocyte expansion molecule isoform X4 [Hyla sarda]|uniref:lymphocyte expansion molecule isoform X4 n=1 Tax=Hyla sarda TaxID=327740 RepID=UPI0024C32757|nr:lymphocyte expansion molecule isoform X4 [Hyla sarda]